MEFWGAITIATAISKGQRWETQPLEISWALDCTFENFSFVLLSYETKPTLFFSFLEGMAWGMRYETWGRGAWTNEATNGMELSDSKMRIWRHETKERRIWMTWMDWDDMDWNAFPWNIVHGVKWSEVKIYVYVPLVSVGVLWYWLEIVYCWRWDDMRWSGMGCWDEMLRGWIWWGRVKGWSGVKCSGA